MSSSGPSSSSSSSSNSSKYPAGFTVVVAAKGEDDTLWGYNEVKNQFVLLGKIRNVLHSFNSSKGFLFDPYNVGVFKEYGEPVLVRKVNAGEFEHISLIAAIYDLNEGKYTLYEADRKRMCARITDTQRRILNTPQMFGEWIRAKKERETRIDGISMMWNIEHKALYAKCLRKNNKNPHIMETVTYPYKVITD